MSRTLEDRLFRINTQILKVENIDCNGKVLDIGGGGEGIIGQLLGERVISIDPSKKELEEAPKGPLKIIMDARELRFLDETFDIVTSFFTMMYIKREDHKKVLEEVYRVLKPGGQFLIWDVVIPEFNNLDKDIFMIPLQIEMKGRTIDTGYGVLWKDNQRDLEYYASICKKVGFKVNDTTKQGKTFYIKLIK